MAFSFLRLMLSESNSIVYDEACRLVEEKHLQMRRQGTAACTGEIDGYKIWLGFSRIGVPTWQCTCTKSASVKTEEPCSHAIALSILWDRSRSVPDPSKDDVDFLTKKS